MPRWLVVCNSLILILLGGALAYVISAGSNLRLVATDAVGPSEFISIILTALAVILGALTLMIGLLALLGWSSFQTMVEKKAEQSTRGYLKNRFGDEDEAYLQIVEDIKEDVRVRLIDWMKRYESWYKEEGAEPRDGSDDGQVLDNSDG